MESNAGQPLLFSILLTHIVLKERETRMNGLTQVPVYSAVLPMGKKKIMLASR